MCASFDLLLEPFIFEVSMKFSFFLIPFHWVFPLRNLFLDEEFQPLLGIFSAILRFLSWISNSLSELLIKVLCFWFPLNLTFELVIVFIFQFDVFLFCDQTPPLWLFSSMFHFLILGSWFRFSAFQYVLLVPKFWFCLFFRDA